MRTIGEVTARIATWNPSRSSSPAMFNYIDLSSVDNDTKEITAPTLISSIDAPSRARQIVATGDVLISTVRPNLNAVAMVPRSLDGATASTGFTVLRPTDRVEGAYLFHWVRSLEFISDMVRKATGASYPAVSDRIVKESLLPLPPRQAQRRIAALLDQADALRAMTLQRTAHLEALGTSMFVEAFGPNARRAVTPRPMAMRDREWPWVPLVGVAALATGHTPDRKRKDYWGGSIPWLSLPDVRALDGRVAWGTRLNITSTGVENSSAVILPAGSVCFSRTASIGFVTTLGVPMATSQDFHNWIPGEAINAQYLMAALRASRAHLLSVSDGSTHKTIYQRIAASFHILLPPRELQDEFADRLSEWSAARDRADTGRLQVESLTRSLKQRAFMGQLQGVPA